MADQTTRDVRWRALSRAEITAARDEGALVVVPTGSIEQHADHLPVETDTVLATAVAERAARRVPSPRVLVAPTVAQGLSPHHLSWPGTVSLRLSTYLAVLSDVAQSILGTGFPRVLFVNGHGGNIAPLRALCTEMVTDGHPVGMVNYFDPGMAVSGPLLKGARKGLGHACEFETAMMMALAAEDASTALRAPSEGLPQRTMQPWIPPGHPSDPISEAGAGWPPIFQADDCGYSGDPGVATLETGQDVLEATVAHLAAFFTRFAATPLRVGIAPDPDVPRISPPLV
ncbi:MAG: creatininase family protein [Pseudomonadota bacterium]